MITTARIPLCWPDARGRCACGRGHREKAIGKAPLVAWEDLVTTPPTAEQIRVWASKYPACNWGLLLEPAGELVIDLDGDAARVEALSYGLPPATVVRTGQGSHYRYRAPQGVAGKRSTKRGHSKKIDILAGGYVVIPPSRHRNGHRYEWLIAPDVRPLGDPPDWAVRMLLESTPAVDAADVALPERLPDVDLDGLHVSPRIRALIVTGVDARYPSRSEALFAVVQALIYAGQNDALIAAVLLDTHHGISAKPRELGRRWVARELARARAKADVEIFT
jgi:hypothetical protein